MKNAVNLKVLGVLVCMSAGLLLNGCKSAPDLTQAEAQAMIQAKYDQTPPVGANVIVDDLGMRQGIAAKYWTRTTIYPNKYWADFTLTPDGKKAVKLSDGGDVIKWRPESLTDKNYSIVVTTTAANRPRIRDVSEPQDAVVPGAATGKSSSFVESVNLDGVPDALQQIAHNPGNKLSRKRQANFSLEGGAWKLHSID